MNERIKVLRDRLPNGVLNLISMFDSHPTADLMKKVKIRTWTARLQLARRSMSKRRRTPHTRIRGLPSQIVRN